MTSKVIHRTVEMILALEEAKTVDRRTIAISIQICPATNKDRLYVLYDDENGGRIFEYFASPIFVSEEHFISWKDDVGKDASIARKHYSDAAKAERIYLEEWQARKQYETLKKRFAE